MEGGRFSTISVAHLPQKFRDQLNAELDNQPPLHSRNDRFLVTGGQDIFHIDPYAYGWYLILRHDYLEGGDGDIEAESVPPFLRDLCLWMRVHGLDMVRIDTDGLTQVGLSVYEDGEDLPSCTE